MKSILIHRINSVIKAKSSLVFIILIITLTLSLYRNLTKIKNADQKIEDVRKKVENLTRENRELAENLDSMRSPAFTEKQLRDKLGLAKEGEIVIVMPSDEVLRKLVPKEWEEEEVLPEPNWMKWKKLFF